MGEHLSSSVRNVYASETGEAMHHGRLVARAKPLADDRPIGITCRLCGSELRDNDDLSVHERQLVHLSCADEQIDRRRR